MDCGTGEAWVLIPSDALHNRMVMVLKSEISFRPMLRYLLRNSRSCVEVRSVTKIPFVWNATMYIQYRSYITSC
jgi:hypothetical protein